MVANLNFLTSKQKKVYSAIESYLKSKGIPPTVREIGEMIGEKTPGAVQGILNRLEQKGVIRRQMGMARSIQLVSENSLFTGHVYIPEIRKITRRYIDDLLNIYNIMKYQPVPADMLSPGKQYFMIDNPDNSLFSDDKWSEDKLVISMGSDLKNSEMGLFMYENLVLLRQYFETEQKDIMRLVAGENILGKELFNKSEIIQIGRLDARIIIY